MTNPTVRAFQVSAALFNRICGVLNQLPASQVRRLLNEIEDGGAQPIYDEPLARNKAPDNQNGNDGSVAPDLEDQ